jgi:hypothetical protein
MSSIIRATTTSGLQIVPDNSGSLILQTNGTTAALTIDTSQNVAFAKGFTVGATAAPTFSASMSATQTITTSTFTKVNFNTEAWDTNSNYDTSTYRFTPTVAGYYQVSCSIDAGASTSASRVLPSIYKNGSGYRYGVNLATVAGNSFSSVCSSIVYMNGSTDYIECYGYIIATTAIISPSGGTWFDACLIRSA